MRRRQVINNCFSGRGASASGKSQAVRSKGRVPLRLASFEEAVELIIYETKEGNSVGLCLSLS